MQLIPLPQVEFAGLDMSRPHIMGILNITPDSFSDGGRFNQRDAAVRQAEQMITEGASIIDIGGESTRPHAQPVSVDEELERIVPIVEALRYHDIKLSIDSSSPDVIRAAVAAGAHIWNDVRALKRPQALATAAELDIPVILMHMRGEPDTMNTLAVYDDVVQTVKSELMQRVEQALQSGISKHNIMLDPGFGFAKNTAHNFTLLNEFWQCTDLGFPLLAGVSRKRFIGDFLNGAAPSARDLSSATAHLLTIQQGASIVRTHHVKILAEMINLWQATVAADSE